ncbi:Rad52/Rad22 family DNA repair protein [Streptacidiphilus cavernicola]|uniref:Rad52/Rad22 family DNA repair protein n=1 Tax=Streptacidiphilus cavernicola TaxID=3342716 RepID=A0ABV6VYD5_9ACTN
MTVSTPPRGLTAQQLEWLLKPLDPARVLPDERGMAYLAQWDARRWLLRILGWGGFDIETLALDLVREIEHPDPNPDAERGPKPRWTVIYRAQVRLTIRDPHGTQLARFDDVAVAESARQPSLGDAHDNAAKSALSGALKRASVNLGDQFGLSLYSGVKRGQPITQAVVATIGNTATATALHTSTTAPVDPPVTEDPAAGEPTNAHAAQAAAEPECSCTMEMIIEHGDHAPGCALSDPAGSL